METLAVSWSDRLHPVSAILQAERRTVAGAVDGVLEFRFGKRGGFDMKVLELTPGKRVAWKVVDGPKEWIGTKISWDLRKEGERSIVMFKHEGWREPVEFMHHCSTKWAVFLMSLKSLVENGRGAPSPNDVKIDNDVD